MREAEKEAESWKRMVLRSLPRPAWLSADAPHVDVVLSSRTRFMRNLAGHRFPHRADSEELLEVMASVLGAVEPDDKGLHINKALTNAERDHLVGCRLVSPDFEWTLPGRALLLDEGRSLSLMINEEDHLRLQALSAGWSITQADAIATRHLEILERSLRFAWSPHYGYLSASPFNLGSGRRLSAMFHLIGLAQVKRLPSVMKALSARGISVRGLFGESSRAVGAFVQVSVVNLPHEDFVGACEYLLREERQARSEVGLEVLTQRAESARDFVLGSRALPLVDALRVLAWVRWAAAAGVAGLSFGPRDIDQALTTLEIRPAGQEDRAGRQRADFLRSLIAR